MAARTDTKHLLPEARICEICGVTQQYRGNLVKRGLLRAAKDGCSLRDAKELAAVTVLADALGSIDTTAAVTQLTAILAKTVPAGRFDLVYDLQYKRLAVAGDDETLRELVTHGRLVKVFALSELFAEIADAFRRVAAASTTPTASTSERTSRADAHPPA